MYTVSVQYVPLCVQFYYSSGLAKRRQNHWDMFHSNKSYDKLHSACFQHVCNYFYMAENMPTANWCIKKLTKPSNLMAVNMLIKVCNYILRSTCLKDIFG